jgi:hypothetical protein
LRSRRLRADVAWVLRRLLGVVAVMPGTVGENRRGLAG